MGYFLFNVKNIGHIIIYNKKETNNFSRELKSNVIIITIKSNAKNITVPIILM